MSSTMSLKSKFNQVLPAVTRAGEDVHAIVNMRAHTRESNSARGQNLARKTATKHTSQNRVCGISSLQVVGSDEQNSATSRRRSLEGSRIDANDFSQARSRPLAKIDPERFSRLSAACELQQHTRYAVVNSEVARSPAGSDESITSRRRSLAASRIDEDAQEQPGQPSAIKIDQRPSLGSSAASSSQTDTHYAVVNPGVAGKNIVSSDSQVDPASLWVATTAHWMMLDSDPERAREIEIDGKCYRRLDVRYWAWLTVVMDAATRAFEIGELSAANYAPLWVRFRELKAMVGDQFAEDEIEQEKHWLKLHTFAPPTTSPELKTARKPATHAEVEQLESENSVSACNCFQGQNQFSQEVSEAAIAKIDAIREQALTLEWTEQELYSTTGEFQFPMGNGWGLVCFVDDDELEIGEVTSEAIVIRKRTVGGRESVMRWRSRITQATPN